MLPCSSKNEGCISVKALFMLALNPLLYHIISIVAYTK